MKALATVESLEKINLFPATRREEIMQNVAALAATPQMSVPLMRDMGMPMEYMYRPAATAKALFESELVDQIDKYENRVVVRQVQTTGDELQGVMFPKVEVGIDG